MFRLNQFFTLAIVLVLVTLGQVEAKTKVSTKNAKQASSLQAAAVFLKPGSYTLENVKTGQRLYYSADRKNHIFPAPRKSKKSTNAVISRHANSKLPWHMLRFGKKNKCLSSAWGSTSNNAGVMYVCASGKGGKKTTLEKTKQYWLFVPVGQTSSVKAKPTSYANLQLIAAQADSIETRNKKLAAQKKAFNRKRSLERGRGRGGGGGGGEDLHSRMMVQLKKRALERRANKTVSGGTFFMLPIDHLLDTGARALTGRTIVTRGIKNTLIKAWNKHDKSQQWRVTRN